MSHLFVSGDGFRCALFTHLLHHLQFSRGEDLLDIKDDDKLTVLFAHPLNKFGIQLRSNTGRWFDMIRIQIHNLLN